MDRFTFLLLNLGHFLTHLFMLIFAGVAALALVDSWGVTYSDLLTYATPGFVAFGLFALPAGWLADKWNADGMLCVFFIGAGLASIATCLAQTPLQISVGLFVIGAFAAIYHPVGLAVITIRCRNTGMSLAVNGVWGNMGVAGAALITGFLIDYQGWRAAFLFPGLFSVVCGLLYVVSWRRSLKPHESQSTAGVDVMNPDGKPAHFRRTSIVVLITTAVSSVIFQSTTFALPKVFDERLQGVASQTVALVRDLGINAEGEVATMMGLLTFVVFAFSSVAQLLVGRMLDHFGPRRVFLAAAAVQCVFFTIMPGLEEGWALLVTFGFMLGAFGQIPINDYLIGKMARGGQRARIYGARFLLSFTMTAATLPMIAFVYDHGGFDRLFQVLSCAALAILFAVWQLPKSETVLASSEGSTLKATQAA